MASCSRSVRSATSTSTSTWWARAQLLGHLLEAGGVAGDQDEVVAAGGELDGVLVADAGRRAGDE